MAFLGGLFSQPNTGSKINKAAKQQQHLIGQGMDQLNAIFKGGSYGVNPLTSYQAGQPMYNSKGEAYQFDVNDPAFQKFYAHKKAQQGGSSLLGGSIGGVLGGALGNFGGSAIGAALGPVGAVSATALGGVEGSKHGKQQGGPGQGGINENRWEKKYGNYLTKQGDLFGGTQHEQGFGPDFYNQASDAYIQYALPQLMSQYDQNRRQLDYRLADQGLQGGSAANDLTQRLSNEAVLQKQAIANEALNRARQMEQGVNQQYAQLAGQLQQSANPTATTQQALQAAAQFSAPSYAGPIGQLFGNFANQYLAGKMGQQYGAYARTSGGAPLTPFSNQSSSSFVRS